MTSCCAPEARAVAAAAASSRSGKLADCAVMPMAFSPNSCVATCRTSAESTPPENATTTRPNPRMISRSVRSFRASSGCMPFSHEAFQRVRDLGDRFAALARDAQDVVVFQALADAAVDARALDAHLSERRIHLHDLPQRGQTADGAHAHAERRGLAQHGL